MTSPRGRICLAIHHLRAHALTPALAPEPFAALGLDSLAAPFQPPSDSAHRSGAMYTAAHDALTDAWARAVVDADGAGGWIGILSVVAAALEDDAARTVYLVEMVPVAAREGEIERRKRAGDGWGTWHGVDAERAAVAAKLAELCRLEWEAMDFGGEE